MTDVERSERHKFVCNIISRFMKGHTHTLNGNVSSHVVNAPTTFADTNLFLEEVRASGNVQSDQLFIGSSSKGIQISACFDRNTQEASQPSRKKRKRQEQEDALDAQVSDYIGQIRRQVRKGTEVGETTLTEAKTIVKNLLTNVKGPNGEQVIESWGLSSCSSNGAKLAKSDERPLPQSSTKDTTHCPNLVLSLRLSPGAAVPLIAIKRAMGRSFLDGMITLSNTPGTIPQNISLPISDQGGASEQHGQPSLFIFAGITV